MFFITGDTHGGLDKFEYIEEMFEPTEKDYVIICGDWGFLFSDSQFAHDNFEKLTERKYTILFLDGNHERFPLLNDTKKFPVEEWNGGKVHRIRPNIIHLMRGQVFDIEGKSFFTFGGAFSVDRGFKVRNVSYWDEEIPNQDEINEGRASLEKVGNKVDYIMTHTLPSSVIRMLGFDVDDKPDKHFTDFLDDVRTTVEYKKWFAGHFHLDKYANESDNIRILYNNVVVIE